MRRFARTPSTIALLALFALVGTLLSPLPVAAAATQPPNQLTYWGGPVKVGGLVYVDYWGSQWATGFSTGNAKTGVYTSGQAQNYIDDFFAQVGGSPWANIMTQYCMGITPSKYPNFTTSCGNSGTHITNTTDQLAGIYIHNTVLPTRMSGTDIRNEAVWAMHNAFGGYNPNATYFIFTPQGYYASNTPGRQPCAWHDAARDIGLFYQHLVSYAYVPYEPSFPNCTKHYRVNQANNSYGNGYFDAFSGAAGHEYAEVLTNPYPHLTASWLFANKQSFGQEIADKCDDSQKQHYGNITLGSHIYAVQALWSNADNGCVFMYPSSGGSGGNATGNDRLNGIAALSASDIWAVGERNLFSATPESLIEHWDGSKWTAVTSPVLVGMSVLTGVATVSTNDVWAVGYDSTGGIIEHWDGSNWSMVTGPTPTFGSDLEGVAAISSNDVWAVGSGAGTPFIVHWNGKTWSVVTSPNPAGSQSTSFSAVAAVSSNDIWTVGYAANDTLVEHWDGSNWTIVSSPSAGVNARLSSVTTVSSNDVWAVGYYTDTNYNEIPLAEHWDGSAWSIVTSPNPTGSQNLLSGVTAVSSTDVWAVGRNYGEPMIQHWDGANWTIATSPDPAPGFCCGPKELFGAVAVSSNDVWAVGDYPNWTDSSNTSGGDYTLTEHWNGTNWSVVPSGSP